MATSTEDLLINLELDAKGFRTDLKKTGKALVENEQQSKALEKELKKLEKSFQGAAEHMKKLEKNLDDSNKVVAESKAIYEDTAEAVNALTASYKIISGSVESVVVAFRELANTTSNLFLVIDKLTDPEFIMRLSKLFLVLGSVSRIKGNKELGNALTGISERLGESALYFSQFRKDGQLSLEALAEKASLLNDLKKALDFTGLVGSLLVFSGVVTGVSEVLFSFGLTSRKLSTTLSKLPAFVKAQTDPYGQLYKAIDRTAVAALDLFDAIKTIGTGSVSFTEFVKKSDKAMAVFRESSKEVRKSLALLKRTSDRALATAFSQIESVGNGVKLFFKAGRQAGEAFTTGVSRMVLTEQEPYAIFEEVAQTSGQRFSRAFTAFAQSEFSKELGSFGKDVAEIFRGVSRAVTSETSVIAKSMDALRRVMLTASERIFKSVQFRFIVKQVMYAGEAISEFSQLAAADFSRLQLEIKKTFFSLPKFFSAATSSIISTLKDNFAPVIARAGDIFSQAFGEKRMAVIGDSMRRVSDLIGFHTANMRGDLLELGKIATLTGKRMVGDFILGVVTSFKASKMAMFAISVKNSFEDLQDAAPLFSNGAKMLSYAVTKEIVPALKMKLLLLGNVREGLVASAKVSGLWLTALIELGTAVSRTAVALASMTSGLLILGTMARINIVSTAVMSKHLFALSMGILRVARSFSDLERSRQFIKVWGKNIIGVLESVGKSFVVLSSIVPESVKGVLGIFKRSLPDALKSGMGFVDAFVQSVTQGVKIISKEFQQVVAPAKSAMSALEGILSNSFSIIKVSLNTLSIAAERTGSLFFSIIQDGMIASLTALSKVPGVSSIITAFASLRSAISPTLEELSGAVFDTMRVFSKFSSFIPTIIDDVLFTFRELGNVRSLSDLGKVFSQGIGASFILTKNVAVKATEEIIVAVGERLKTLGGIAKVSGGLFSSSMAEAFDDILLATLNFEVTFTNAVRAALNTTTKVVKSFTNGFAVGFSAPLAAAGEVVKSFSKASIPSMLNLTEAGSLAAPAMLAIGAAARNSESAVVRFAGALSILAGVILGGLSTAMVFFLSKIGEVTAAIGRKLFNAMQGFEQSFQKAQLVTEAFTFTVLNFSDALGTEVVGSLSLWESTVNEMVQTTTHGGGEIRKAIQLLIAEAQAVELSLSQSQMLLARASDLAAAKQRDLSEVIDSLIAGISGQSQAVRSLGINLTESHMEHSKFTKVLEDQGVEINEHSKKLLRFNEIMAQSAPQAGFAAKAVETIAGAGKQLDKTLESIEVRLGQQGAITTAYLVTLNNLAKSFLDLPGPMLDVVGVLIDVGGVVGMGMGTFIQYGVVLASLSTLYTLLNAGIVKSTFLQAQLTAASTFAATAMNIKTVAVINLSTAMTNLTRIIGAGLLATLKSLVGILVTATLNMARFTASLLVNPLFLKGAIIAASIFAIIEAYKQLRKELDLVSVANEHQGKGISKVSEAMKSLGEFFKRGFQGLVNLMKIVVIGWMKLITLLQIAAKGFQLLASKIPLLRGLVDSQEQLSDQTRDLIAELGDLDDALFSVIGGGTAMAGELEGAFDSVGDSIKGAAKAAASFKLLPIQAEDLKIDVLGTEAEKARRKFDDLNTTLNFIREKGMIKIDTELLIPTEENIRKLEKGLLDKGGIKAKFVPATSGDLEKATLDAGRAYLEMEKMRRTAIDETRKSSESLSLQELEASGKAIAAIKARGDIELKQLKELQTEQAKLIPLTLEQARAFEELERRIKKATELKILEKQKEQLDQFNAAFKGLADENMQLSLELAEVGKSTLEIAQLRLDAQLRILDQKAKEISDSKIFNADQKKALLEQIKLKKILLEMRGDDSNPEQETAGKRAADLTSKFLSGAAEFTGPKGVGGMLGGVSAFAGSVTGFMAAADTIADFVQKLIDFLPNFMKKLANIFESLTNLPEKFTKEFANWGKQMENFAKNFFGNLMKFFSTFISTFLDSFIDGMPKAIEEGIGKFADEFEKFFTDKFPKIIERIFSGVFGGIGINIVNSIIKNVPRIIKAYIKGFPLFVKAIVNGLILGAKQMANHISRALGRGKIFNLPKDLEKSMDKVGKKIGRANEQLFRVLDLEAEAKAANLQARLDPAKIGKSIWDWLMNAFKNAHKFFMALGKLIWDGFVQPILNFFKEKGADIWNGFKEAIGDATKWFKEKGAMLWNGFKEAIGDIAKWFGDRGTEIWNGFILPVATWFGDRGTEIWNGFLLPVATWFGDRGTEIWDGFIRPVGEWFGEAGTKLWNGFVKGFTTLGDTISGIMSKALTSLQEGLKKVPGALKEAFDKLQPQNLMSKVFTIDFKGTDKIENLLKIDVPWAKFAKGGLIGKAGGSVPGVPKLPGDSPLNDVVPAILSPGEAVIPKSIMENPMAKAVVDALLAGKVPTLQDASSLIMDQISSGMQGLFNNPFKFSEGGIVGGGLGRTALASMGGTSNISNNYEIEIELKIDASAQSLDAGYVRNRLIPEIKKELKNASLRGDFLLSDRGLR